MDYVLDAGESTVRVSTFAEGMFAKVAHDLVLTWTNLTGRAADPGTVDLVLPIGELRVLGTLTARGIDRGGLSAAEQEACLEKMRREVFSGAGPKDVVRVEGSLDAGEARIVATLPRGRTFRASTRPSVVRTTDRVHVESSFDVSIAALGAGPVKGPLGAFRVKDRVAVAASLVFRAVAQPA